MIWGVLDVFYRPDDNREGTRSYRQYVEFNNWVVRRRLHILAGAAEFQSKILENAMMMDIAGLDSKDIDLFDNDSVFSLRGHKMFETIIYRIHGWVNEYLVRNVKFDFLDGKPPKYAQRGWQILTNVGWDIVMPTPYTHSHIVSWMRRSARKEMTIR